MKVLYTRVSTQEQNSQRQTINAKDYEYVLTDYCSGAIPLFERPQGKKLKVLIASEQLKELHIHSIDRLGRNATDVFNVWKELTEKGIIIQCKNPGIRNFDENGKIDAFSQLLMGIMTSMADFERTLIKERQMEGIAIRKLKGLYTGRMIGTKDSTSHFLSKPKNKLIAKYLLEGKNSYREIARIIPCSPATIVKVKQALEKKEILREAGLEELIKNID